MPALVIYIVFVSLAFVPELVGSQSKDYRVQTVRVFLHYYISYYIYNPCPHYLSFPFRDRPGATPWPTLVARLVTDLWDQV